MPRRQKIAVRQVNALTRKDCVDKASAWSQEYPPSLFSGDKDECKFTHEDLRSSFVAGIKQYLQSVWHDAQKELPKDGEWCLLQTTSGFRLAVRRTMNSGAYKWWLMDYSMYDGKDLERWAYVIDLVLYR